MAKKKTTEVYKSFEQVKSEVFPKLSEEEKERSSKWTSSQLGTNLADSAIDELLSNNPGRA